MSIYFTFKLFEYDTECAAYKAKHGIDFEEPQSLWDDPFLVT